MSNLNLEVLKNLLGKLGRSQALGITDGWPKKDMDELEREIEALYDVIQILEKTP